MPTALVQVIYWCAQATKRHKRALSIATSQLRAQTQSSTATDAKTTTTTSFTSTMTTPQFKRELNVEKKIRSTKRSAQNRGCQRAVSVCVVDRCKQIVARLAAPLNTIRQATKFTARLGKCVKKLSSARDKSQPTQAKRQREQKVCS